MSFRREIINRLEVILGSDNPLRSREQERAELALARQSFRLLASSGPDGQTPVASYKEGNTLILSDLLPGTILRERYQDDQTEGEDYYIFWVVGGIDQKSGGLKMFDAFHPRIDHRSPYLTHNPLLSAIKRIIPTNSGKKSEFTIGQPGIIVDQYLRTTSTLRMQTLSETRHTEQIDILQFGTKAEVHQRERVTSALTRLVPLRPSA